MNQSKSEPTGLQHGALSGLTVIEHASGVAASYAGRALALMGATVIKIEPPSGDPLRQQVPLLPTEPAVGALYTYLNVNKSSVTLDTRLASGQALLAQLLDKATILLDDTYPERRATLGITPEQVRTRHPHLIYVSVLPFGASGPHASYRAQELNVFHAGGEGYLMPNGLTLEMFPERPPVKIYGHFAEFTGGTSAACAAIAAAFIASEAGGQFVDISVQDANVANGCFAMQRLGDGVLENRKGRSFKYGGVMQCADGYVQLLVLEDHQWDSLVELVGSPAWATVPEFKDALERGRRGAEINRNLRAWAATQKVDELVQQGQARRIPFARYAEPGEVLAAEQSRVRGMFSTIEMGGGEYPMLVAPYQASSPVPTKLQPVQGPGDDNQRIWCEWLGHSSAELAGWVAQGTV